MVKTLDKATLTTKLVPLLAKIKTKGKSAFHYKDVSLISQNPPSWYATELSEEMKLMM
jgi:hypothetical protein